MGVVDYWSEHINKCKEYIKSDEYIINLSVKDLCDKNTYSKYFFFKNRVEFIKFLKYVSLPTFIYKKIDAPKNINKIEIQDYKDVLNFFVGNDIVNGKELIKRYSFFYNSLEEFEYEKSYIGDESLLKLVDNINSYFSKDGDITSNIKVYLGTEELLEIISNDSNENFSKKMMKNFGAENMQQLKEFLSNNKNNEAIINFVAEILNENYIEDNIAINL
ncbi:MAG: hypothetical protein ACRC6T_04935 [Sarcina sp.]